MFLLLLCVWAFVWRSQPVGCVPTVAVVHFTSVQGEMVALVALITPNAKLVTDRKQQNHIPVTVFEIYKHSKIGKLNVMYNNPRPGEQ